MTAVEEILRIGSHETFETEPGFKPLYLLPIIGSCSYLIELIVDIKEVQSLERKIIQKIYAPTCKLG